MENQQQLLLKIASIGDPQVGKSCLIKRYCEGRFVNKYITTIGVDYGVKKMTILNQKCSINFFDMSGDEDYAQIRNPFFKDVQGLLLVFDLGNKQSFNNLQKWERIAKENGLNTNKASIYVIGNKSDAKKEVSESDAQNFSKRRGWEYFTTSASNGDNVTSVFEKLFFRVVTNIQDDQSRIQK